MTVNLKSKESTSPNLKPLFKPFIIFLVLIIANIAVFRFGYTLVTDQLKDVEQSRETNQELANKVELLSEISTTISADSSSLLEALPSRNSSLTMLYQIDVLATQLGLRLIDSSVGTPTPFGEDIYRSVIAVTVESENPIDAIKYALELPTFSPYNTPERLDIKRSQGIFSTDIDTYIFWSHLPTTIAPTTEPISDLSSGETEVIARINALKKPQFETIEPRSELPRTNPFN